MAWIPVSEHLPKEGQEILVTVWEDCSYGKGTDIHTHVDMATFQIGGGYIPVDEKYSPDGGYFDTFNDWMEGQPCKILAWMPLPEPYEEEKKMYGGVEETQCTHCDHLQVCSLKEQFIAAQNAVNRLSVNLGDRTTKDLRNFDWIKKVKLECEHFAAKRPTQRDISTENQARGTLPYPSEGGKFMENPT